MIAHKDNQKDKVKNANKQIWWEVIAVLTVVHTVAGLSLLYYTPAAATVKLTTWLVALGAFGITMGYHRLWSHNSYKAILPIRAVLAFMGTLAFEGSIKWWSLRHRLHHRYTDTDHGKLILMVDPYDATKGFLYSHIGWMLEKQTYTRIKWIDKSDLDDDEVVQFQHKYYPQLALVSGIFLPTLLGFFWGDAVGGFLYGGFVSRIAIWHCTWFINSLAHSWGEQTFSTENTSRGNLLLALLTMGEGHHNYHHEFPRDFRNGIHWDDWDPTKWLIAGCNFFGMTYDLITVPEDVILKAKVSTAMEHIADMNSKLIWSDETKLPQWTKDDFINECKNNELIILDGFAVDIREFKDQHPGGSVLLTKYIGKDATKSFYGVLNNHTKSAKQMMTDLRVAKIIE
ncbi:hypothetical protein HDV01_007055 [Terramyces sp. JEL0728]|nr:hypothetical protein HDV01_007055 [Terramyces sp. JEL0728]